MRLWFKVLEKVDDRLHSHYGVLEQDLPRWGRRICDLYDALLLRGTEPPGWRGSRAAIEFYNGDE